MTIPQVDRYRTHEVWEMIRLKQEALESARFSSQELENGRLQMLEMLRLAARSRANNIPLLYDSPLDHLRDALNSLTTDEGEFRRFMNGGGLEQAKDHIRVLPGPPPRQVNDQYLDALDSAISLRAHEIEALRAEAEGLATEVSKAKALLSDLAGEVRKQDSNIQAAAATITQVVDGAAERLEAAWTTKIDGWEVDRSAKDAQFDEEMTAQVRLLTGAAAVGERLVEHAAGQLTATDWAARAKRERLNAVWLRWGSLLAFAATLTTGAYILWRSIEEKMQLTIGDGILRGAIVLALAGIGTFLTSEARRHFREADSAEEVTLAMRAIEPFYAGAGDTARNHARAAVGDTVFVRNVLSRFASRDATRHNANQDLSKVIDTITKGADVATKISAR